MSAFKKKKCFFNENIGSNLFIKWNIFRKKSGNTVLRKTFKISKTLYTEIVLTSIELSILKPYNKSVTLASSSKTIWWCLDLPHLSCVLCAL